jgi:polar amino acid transport system substrate-binding protein
LDKIGRKFCCNLFFIFLALLLPVFPVFAEDLNEDTLSAIKKRGILQWGSDAEGGAPYSYYDPENPTQLIGYEVDLIKIIAKKLNVKEEMIQNEWDALVSGLKRKNFDLAISGIEVTEARKQEINFSRPYYIYSQQIVVHKDEKRINKPEDLKGKVVGTLSASAAQKILEKMGMTLGKEIRVYPSVVGAYSDLANKRLEAVLLDLPIANFYAKPNPALKFVGEPFGRGYYAICVRKEDTRLLNRLNEIIGEMLANGDIERVCRKWHIWTPIQKELITNNSNISTTINQPAKNNNGKSGVDTTPIKRGTFERMDEELPILLRGALRTIQITCISMFFAVILGLSIAIIRLYGPLPARILSAAYVEIMRGTPLLIQLYIIYYGLPEVGIKLEAFTAAILGLALNYAAYEAENYRAGIKSIPFGQMEAALALGMTRNMALRKVIIPQAIKVVIPPVTNDFIAMFKDSSIVSVITMVELTKSYNFLASSTFDYIGLGIIVAALYFMMSYPASLFAKTIENRLSNEQR